MPVESEREAARQARLEAERKLNDAGETELNRILQTSVKSKLAALENNKALQPLQRRKLVDHLEALVGEPEKAQTISSDVATFWEIWWSRLPYRIVPIGTMATVVAGFLLVAVVAYARTPIDAFESVHDQEIQVKWADGQGREHSDVLRPRHYYGRIGSSSDMHELRVWDPEQGIYRSIGVLKSDLKPVIVNR